MRQYIISIAVSAVVSAIVGIITPDKWGKYVRIITGLVIVLCIANPVFSLLRSNVFDGFSYSNTVTLSNGEEVIKRELISELSSRIENDISERIRTEYNRSNTAKVDISVNDEGAITGVNKIVLYGDSMTDAVYNRMKEVYGTNEVTYGGTGKNTSKSE